MGDEAIPAATLVVWRDSAPDEQGGPKILVVERSAGMAFAGGAVVFPGGRVDPADRALAEALGRPGEAGKITAIRETIEETGVIAGLRGAISPRAGRDIQEALHKGADFAQLLGERDLTPELDALVQFARWMPGFKHPRKFDTLFYLAAAPHGDWPPNPQPGECESAEWAGPGELLDRIDRGEASAIFPTKRNLERLAQYPSFEDALTDAGAHSLDTIIPWIEEIGGVRHVRIPDDRGYPVLSEPLATAFRA
jgi:8-oxo-dGTP pyrophosphatase MutT (NUDIX family)